MTEKTTAVFFDGESSTNQEIELFFDNEKRILFFETSKTKQNIWEIDTILFDKKGKKLNLQYGNNPIQNIVIEDENFINSVNSYRNKNNSWYDNLIGLGVKFHITLALIVIGFIGLSYLYIIPFVAEKSLVLIPENYDTKLGQLFFDQNMVFREIDTAKTKSLNLFAKELKLQNTKKLQFFVVNSSEVNAFALPDGSVVVYTGILNSMKNYDELVGLIGHEVAHINNRDSMKMLCRNLSGYLFISAILGDVNGIMATIGDNVNTLQSLSFSREFEHQADIDGFEILTLNKVNPKGMSTLFERLKDENMLSIPKFMSSHPITEDRITYINRLIKSKSFPFEENLKLKKLFQELKK